MTHLARSRPVLVSLCWNFVPQGMMHVYRQVCAVRGFDHWVATRQRENATEFPFPQVVTLKKHPLRGLSRLVHRLQGRRVPFSASETRQLLRFTREKQAAVVHIYLGNIAAKMLDYLRQERAARIVSFHGGDLAGDMTDAEFQALCQHTDLFLARSRSLAAALQERGCPAERIRLNTTGVPLPEPFVQKTAPLAGRTVRMLQACRLIGKKGLDVSLQTLARLVQQGRDVTLDLAGAGPEEPMLRGLAQRLGIAARVQFLGFVENATLLAALPSYDVFIHPSRTTESGDREGIPNSLLEAMACGVPVVATRHSGIPEAVTHEESGLLIDAAEPEALARAIETLLDHPTLYARISRAARETVAERFSIAACVQKLEASYHEAMALAQARRPRMQRAA